MATVLDQVVSQTRALFAGLGVIQLVLLSGTSIFLIVFLALYQLLKPVDRRASSSGKEWKLPQGPRGWPIVGNLFLYARGEDGVSGTPLDEHSVGRR